MDTDKIRTVALAPRQTSQMMRLHYEEVFRDLQPLLLKQQMYLDALTQIQKQIQGRLHNCSTMQSPLLPDALNRTQDIVPSRTRSMEIPMLSSHLSRTSESECPPVTAPIPKRNAFRRISNFFHRHNKANDR